MTREFYDLEIVKDEDTGQFVVSYLPKDGGMRRIEDIETIILCNVVKDGDRFRSKWDRCESFEWDSIDAPDSIMIPSNGFLVKSGWLVIVYNVGEF